MAKKLPKIINQEEFEKLFAEVTSMMSKTKCEKVKDRLNRYRIAMLLGFEAGMRLSEIVGYKDIVPALIPEMVEDAQIKILSGKGGKDRIVPRPKRFNETARKMLPLGLKRITLQLFVTRLGKRILNKPISFHTFRHGFGSHLAGQNRPLHEIQMLMGHSRLDTTGIYLHANPTKAIEGARDVF